MTTTEGWAAGLRLATVAIEPAADPATVLGAFSGRHALVSAYLLEEVVAGLGPERADFLMRTSVVDRVCGPLARALTDDPASGAVLESLVADNVLVTALEDTGWFRYHPMLLEMLGTRLRNLDPDLRADLHRRAQVWFESTGEWLEALRHAILSGDQDLAAQVALRSAAVLVFTPERVRLAEVLAGLDIAATSTDPEGQVCQALAAYSRGDHERVGPWLDRAARGLADLPEPRRHVATTVHRLLDIAEARRVGDPYRMYRSSSEAERLVETLPASGSRAWGVYAGMAGSMMGVAELWLGRPGEAERRLTEAVVGIEDAHFGAHGQIYHGGLVAFARVAQGRIAAGRTLAEEVLGTARTSGWSESYEAGTAWLALAVVHLHAADLAAADRCLATARRSGIGARDPFVGAVIALVATRVALTGGDLAGARRALAEADRATPPRSRMSLVTVLRGALEAEIALAAGAPTQAAAILAALDRLRAEAPENEQGPAGDPVAITRGHVLLRTGRPGPALEAVAALRDADGAVAGEAWLVTALAQDRERHDASAMRALERAIDRSAGEDAVLGFLRVTDRLPTLLRRHLDVTGTHAEFVERVLEHLARPAVAEAGPSGPVPEPAQAADLTERELSVLAYLPTLSTNPEIAERLNISVNTVKQHLKTINRKLGVNSRREAVRVAHRLGLLPER